jgi:hypothetical protein
VAVLQLLVPLALLEVTQHLIPHLLSRQEDLPVAVRLLGQEALLRHQQVQQNLLGGAAVLVILRLAAAVVAAVKTDPGMLVVRVQCQRVHQVGLGDLETLALEALAVLAVLQLLAALAALEQNILFPQHMDRVEAAVEEDLITVVALQVMVEVLAVFMEAVVEAAAVELEEVLLGLAALAHRVSSSLLMLPLLVVEAVTFSSCSDNR